MIMQLTFLLFLPFQDAKENYGALINNLNALNGRNGFKCSFGIDANRRALIAYLHLNFEPRKKHAHDPPLPPTGEVVVSTCFPAFGSEIGRDDIDEGLIQVNLVDLISKLDHIRAGGEDAEEAIEEMDRMARHFDRASKRLEHVGLPLRQLKELTMQQWEKIKTSVEDRKIPLDADVAAQAAAKLALTLKPYQERALSFMLTEERAPGGSARHHWVKIPLLDEAKSLSMECYVSPVLHRIVLHRSALGAGQTVGTCGGSGWVALEMGMGECCVFEAGDKRIRKVFFSLFSLSPLYRYL
jgi:hypothetical protein